MLSLRKYITKDSVEKIATEKYRENGLGITFEDVKGEFSVNKGKAQRTLKYFHGRYVLFTANDLILDGLNILENKSPQQYFPTCIKAEIIENLSKRKSVLVSPTEPISSKTLLSNLVVEQQKAQNLLDALFLLGRSPLYIHKLQLQLSIQDITLISKRTVPNTTRQSSMKKKLADQLSSIWFTQMARS
jgi:hypothetical protein